MVWPNFKKWANDKIPKRVHVGKCLGSFLVGKLLITWIDSVNDCLKEKRCLDIGQARKMVHKRSEWQGFVRGMLRA